MRSLRLFLAPAALLAASCGGSDPSDDEPEGNPSPEVLAGRIANAMIVPDSNENKASPPRTGVIDLAALPPEFAGGPSCRLTRGDRLLLVATAAGALAQIDGRRIQLRVSGPVGPSGGYFEAPGVTVSVGRRVGGIGPDPATAAGMTVGGDPARPIERLEGRWDCIVPAG